MSIYIGNKKVAGLGKAGTNGKSAYQAAVDAGFEGTEAEWVASLTPTIPLATTTTDGLMPKTHFALLSRELAAKTITSLASLTTANSVQFATLSANQTLSLSGTMIAGQNITVICLAKSAQRTVAIPTTGAWVSMDGASLKIPANKYAEISILYLNSKYIVSSKVQG